MIPYFNIKKQKITDIKDSICNIMGSIVILAVIASLIYLMCQFVYYLKNQSIKEHAREIVRLEVEIQKERDRVNLDHCK